MVKKTKKTKKSTGKPKSKEMTQKEKDEIADLVRMLKISIIDNLITKKETNLSKWFELNAIDSDTNKKIAIQELNLCLDLIEKRRILRDKLHSLAFYNQITIEDNFYRNQTEYLKNYKLADSIDSLIQSSIKILGLDFNCENLSLKLLMSKQSISASDKTLSLIWNQIDDEAKKLWLEIASIYNSSSRNNPINKSIFQYHHEVISGYLQ